MEVWVPRSAKPRWRCRVPLAKGGTCGKAFTEDEAGAFERHVLACAEENEDGVHAQSPKTRLPVLYDSERFGDPEYEAHMHEVGQRMLAEGRWETRPNER